MQVIDSAALLIKPLTREYPATKSTIVNGNALEIAIAWSAVNPPPISSVTSARA